MSAKQVKKEKIKCAVIGAGGIGLTGLTAFAGCDWTSLVAIAEVNDAQRETICRQYNVKGYKNYHDLIADKDVELVYNATPNFLHQEVVLACLDENKHVFSEKPLALTDEDYRAIVKAAGKSKAKLQVDFEMRFSVLPARIKAIIDNGEIGEPRNILFHHISGCHGFGKELDKKVWTQDVAKVGGYYLEEGCHRIDLFRWYMGAEITGVICVPAPELRGDSTWSRAYGEPAVSMYFFKNGGFANLVTLQHRSVASATRETGTDLGHDYDVSIVGRHGAIIADFLKGSIKVLRFKGKNDATELERVENYRDVPDHKWHHDNKGFVIDFCKRVLEGRPVMFDVEDVYKTMKAVFASERSFKEGGAKIKVK